MTKKIAWSWSRLNTFEQCPMKFHHQNILKDVPFEESEAMLRGKRIHAALEEYFKSNTPLPDNLSHAQSIVERLSRMKGAKIVAEERAAFREDMSRTSYFAKDVWLRAVMDLAIQMPRQSHVTILDWKTGRLKDYSDQLEIFALAAFALWPWCETVKTAYVWLDHKATTDAEFTRSQYPHMLQRYIDRSEMIQLANEAGVWKATPNNYCKWCPLSKLQCAHRP